VCDYPLSLSSLFLFTRGSLESTRTLEKSLDRAPRDAGEMEKIARARWSSERFARLRAFRRAPRLITVNHRTPVCARDER